MRIGIVAGESSGDLLGAGLIAAIRDKYPDAIIEGIAGPAMIEQGCKALYPAEKLSLLGIVEVLGHYRELKGIRDDLCQYYIDSRPDVFIGIDAPEFNLGMHEKLHKAGIKTVQYVSPQVWAWRQRRVKKIERNVDLVLSLFPFEVDFYKKHHVAVEFVGHPLADMIPQQINTLAAREELSLANDKKIIALLPGSRVSEVNRLLKPFLATAEWCQHRKPELCFVMPIANDAVEAVIRQAVSEQQITVELIKGESRTVMAAADVVLMASGTATLEGLLLKKPMVVAYKLAWLTAVLFRRLIKLPYYSLPNLLSGKQVIPEIMQEAVQPAILGAAVLDYLEHPEKVNQLIENFDTIHQTLKQGTNQRAAAAVLQLIDQ